MPKRGRDGAEIRPGAAGPGGGKPAALTPSAFHTLPLPKPSHAAIQSIVMRLIFGAEQASKQHGRCECHCVAAANASQPTRLAHGPRLLQTSGASRACQARSPLA